MGSEHQDRVVLCAPQYALYNRCLHSHTQTYMYTHTHTYYIHSHIIHTEKEKNARMSLETILKEEGRGGRPCLLSEPWGTLRTHAAGWVLSSATRATCNHGKMKSWVRNRQHCFSSIPCLQPWIRRTAQRQQCYRALGPRPCPVCCCLQFHHDWFTDHTCAFYGCCKRRTY